MGRSVSRTLPVRYCSDGAPPGITLELVESPQTANLARREADLAVRHHPPESGDLYAAKVGVFACAVYRRCGSGSDAWVTYTEKQVHYATARWVQRRTEETGGAVALRASSVAMQLAAMRAGARDRRGTLRRAVCVRAVIDWVRHAFAEQRDSLAGTR